MSNTGIKNITYDAPFKRFIIHICIDRKKHSTSARTIEEAIVKKKELRKKLLSKS